MIALDVGAWSEASWAAAGAWATVALYVVLAIYAVKQVAEARRLREEQARPFVVVDIDVNFLMKLRIENVGRTVARNIRMDFSPALTSSMSQPWPWERSPLFSDGIPTLAPGKSIRFHFDTYLGHKEQGLDLAYRVDVSYDGFRKRQRLEDTYTLDLNIYEGSARPDKSLPDLIQSVEKINTELHKWTDGSSGVLVKSVDRDRATRIDNRRYWIRRAQQIREGHGLKAMPRYLIERALQRRGWID